MTPREPEHSKRQPKKEKWEERRIEKLQGMYKWLCGGASIKIAGLKIWLSKIALEGTDLCMAQAVIDP